MTDGFRYNGFSGIAYPFWLSSPPPPTPPHHPASAPPFQQSNPVESYDPAKEVFDPMMLYHDSYQRSPANWSNNPSYRENSRSQTPSSSFYADNTQHGNSGLRGEDSSYKDMLSPSGFYSSRESSSDFVSLPPTENFSERQRLNFEPTYSSATLAPVSSYADMLIRNSQDSFFTPIASSGVYSSSNAVDEKRPGYYFLGSDRSETMNVVSASRVEPYMCDTDCNPSFPMPNFITQALFDGSQTGLRVGDGRSFPSNSDVCSHAPQNFLGAQSSLQSSSVEPVNFDVLLGYGEATGHIKPLPENPNLPYPVVGSQGSRSPRSSYPLPSIINSSVSLIKDEVEGSGVSSLYQRPYTLVADSENGVSESSLKNATEDLNCHEPRSWSHFMVTSEGPSAPTMFSMGSESGGPSAPTMKADNENAQSAGNYKPPFEGSTTQPSEDVPTNQESCNLQKQTFDIMDRDKKIRSLTDVGLDLSSRSNADDVSTGRSPERHFCDQGDFPSPTSYPRVSSVVNAMHNLSEVLVYECFNNGSWLKLEQLENLDKVVDNLTKCLKKITDNKTTAGEATLPTQSMHVTCPNVVDLHEAATGVAKDFQRFSVKPLDSFGVKEPVDKNEMTQSIKNILASNFPDGEENHPQTLLYKNLWLETEAALCSTTCMARYHRIKNEIGNLKLNNKEISADAVSFMQEPSLNTQKSVPIMNANADKDTPESIIKHGSNCGKNAATMSHDASESSRINSDPVDAVLSVMSRSFTGGLEQTIRGNLRPDDATFAKIPDAIWQETSASTTENKHREVIDRFQILKEQETERKLKSQKLPDSDIDVIDRFQILKQQETNRKLKAQKCPETKKGDQEDKLEGSVMANMGRSSDVSDVMDRFQILKRREAEQVKKSLNSMDVDSDSENDQPQKRDHLWSDSLFPIRGHSQRETCAADTEQSASGKGYESPTSDWEHVIKDD
ncbi:hypothetical protein [Arabidopsis thaliana]|jgi:hypothetical protein|uniref:Uncharacterized protein T9C5.90 n=1 Tax=Arabidopsis thaliana TaxID=3702 RepID=Q9SCK9_ARATH|nr:uncharacterized protein AT3G49490 [Arabidopsis thaliana]AEE78549.1 hypothetical protein AT3G49490 [Arabidopsis thaliana]CAB62454.1 hypothetical protein [Arabidopsis thaliana]|eukprot:NP_566921.1 hypothetical protein AT3G49490 [Arabidopsis thaliana]